MKLLAKYISCCKMFILSSSCMPLLMGLLPIGFNIDLSLKPSFSCMNIVPAIIFYLLSVNYFIIKFIALTLQKWGILKIVNEAFWFLSDVQLLVIHVMCVISQSKYLLNMQKVAAGGFSIIDESNEKVKKRKQKMSFLAVAMLISMLFCQFWRGFVLVDVSDITVNVLEKHNGTAFYSIERILLELYFCQYHLLPLASFYWIILLTDIVYSKIEHFEIKLANSSDTQLSGNLQQINQTLELIDEGFRDFLSPVIFFSIFALFTSSLGYIYIFVQYEVLLDLMFAVVKIIILWIFCNEGTRINEKIGSLSKHVFNVQVEEVCNFSQQNNALNHAILFHQRMTEHQPKLSAYKCFSLNRSTFLSVAAALGTYAVIIVQFKQ